MKYRNCPNCGSSNHAESSACYNCNGHLPTVTDSAEQSYAFGHENDDAEFRPMSENPKATFTAFVAILLSSIFGGSLGFAITHFEIEMPFFLEEILLGSFCAVATAFCLAKMIDLPEGLIGQRLLPAAGFGSLVGVCLYAIWWSFDPSFGMVTVGAIAGFCSGAPITVSFGLHGGKSAPLGMLEFGNVIGGIMVGMMVAIWICLEDGDFYLVPGITGFCGLLPTTAGGRMNPMTGALD